MDIGSNAFIRKIVPIEFSFDREFNLKTAVGRIRKGAQRGGAGQARRRSPLTPRVKPSITPITLQKAASILWKAVGCGFQAQKVGGNSFLPARTAMLSYCLLLLWFSP